VREFATFRQRLEKLELQLESRIRVHDWAEVFEGLTHGRAVAWGASPLLARPREFGISRMCILAGFLASCLHFDASQLPLGFPI
jgi:hypothetical protein